MVPAQKMRIYKSYHACRPAALRQIITELIAQGVYKSDLSDEDQFSNEEIRQIALKMTAERYHVTISEVSHIVRELRIPDSRPQKNTRLTPNPKKRIHKR